jgi:hypothetical protein
LCRRRLPSHRRGRRSHLLGAPVWEQPGADLLPDEESVVIALVGEHSRGSSDDVYGAVYELLEIDEPTAKRTKPPCCEEDGGPPVDPELFNRMLRAAVRLQRRK